MKLNDIKVIEETTNRQCKKFRADTETCKPGCVAKKVKPGGSCPYDIPEQHNCPCFA